MSDWCHEFDFTRTDLADPQQGFETFAFGIFETGEGFTDDYGVFYGAGYRGCNIRCHIRPGAVIEEIVAEYSATVGANQGNGVNSVLRYNNTGEYTYNTLDTEYPSASTVLSWTGSINNMEYFNVQVTVGYDEVSPITDPGGTVAITRVLVRGSGADPFIEEYDQQQALHDAFDAIRDALHTDPEADISAEIAAYQTEIIAAFGIQLSNDDDADTWNDSMIALHFLRQGLEATAKAFEQWVESQFDEEECQSVSRFDLFKRIMGTVHFRNVETEEDFPALNEQVGDDRRIVVYKRPSASGGGQWYMTPNNVIHELGHWFDNNSGFNFNKIGSLEYTIDDESKGGGNDLHNEHSRHGLAEGRDYLRDRTLEHGTISDSDENNIPEFAPIDNDTEPKTSYPEYNEFVPSRYLFYDVADNLFDVWRSPVYHDRYLNNARIDTLVQNETDDPTETAADAFLNWVRDQEYLRVYQGIRSRRPFYNATGETNADNWIDFFTDNIGMFLRNAVIYNYSGRMVQFYKDRGEIPQTVVTTGVLKQGYNNYGLHPSAKEIPNVHWGTASLLPSPIPIYGWVTPTVAISDGSPYWLLIADNQNRLCWLESDSIDHDESLLNAQNEADAELLSPERAYTGSGLLTIIGE